jgi:ERF superfamily
MRRSSESIAALATALAKAQTELSNPEKSLTAIIRPDRAGGAERSFRYAPLSSGLEIVRKTLGKHEIAVLQTTAVDQPTRSVSLTTMLTHSSGEWITSEWPVCPMSDMAAPHRMGAALTYARRYALFTLVGIAGEDDLDAPDLNCVPAGQNEDPPRSDAPALGPRGQTERGNGGSRGRPLLDPDASARARDRLLKEIVDVPSPEAANDWARQSLPLKNTLIARDARLVETAFAFRLSAFEKGSLPGESDRSGEMIQPQEGPQDTQLEAAQDRRGGCIDKSILTIAEARRYRDKEHLKSVASKPCVICGRKPAEPHHLRFAQRPALGRKVSDEFAVPLCRLHHRELHRSRNETQWWRTARIDPLKVARTLWDGSRLPKGLERSADAADAASEKRSNPGDPLSASEPAASAAQPHPGLASEPANDR